MILSRFSKLERLATDGQHIRPAFAFCASLLLSAWIIFLDPTLNSDGIFYLFTAKKFLTEGISQAIDQYPWPFFTAAIAFLHKLSQLSLHNAAQLIVTLCYALFTAAFVLTVRELGGSRRTQAFALVIILFLPLLTNYRSAIVRDPGFWAFMLLSIVEVLRYSHKPTWGSALRWTGLATLALLFRIEGVILFIATPLALAYSSGQERFRNILLAAKLLVPSLILAIPLLLVALFVYTDLLHSKLIVDSGHYLNFITQIGQNLEETGDAISKTILKHSSREDALFAVYGAYTGIFSINIIRAITPIYFVLMLCACIKGWTPVENKHQWRIINFIAVVIAGYLMVFTLARGFLLERYSFQLVILLTLYLPFIAEYLWAKYSSTLVHSMIIVILSGYALDSVVTSDYKKQYLRDAASWISENTAEETPLISNDDNICYYSQRQCEWTGSRIQRKAIFSQKWQKNTTYAIKIKQNDLPSKRNIIEQRDATIIHELDGGYGKSVIVFAQH